MEYTEKDLVKIAKREIIRRETNLVVESASGKAYSGSAIKGTGFICCSGRYFQGEIQR